MHAFQTKLARKVLISTGEASGDLHGANLANKLNISYPEIKFYGLGGTLMQKAGVELLVHFQDLAIIGVTDLPFKIRKIYSAYKKIKQAILRDRPDLLILIDLPDFNLRLAKVAKKAGIKVLYYISPQIWAWRKGRIKLIERCVDHMAVIFPFEVRIYEEARIPVTFVGNPLLDLAKPSIPPNDAKEKFGLNDAGKIIGLLPGSRSKEIRYILPTMIKAAELIKKKYGDAKFVLPLASSRDQKDLAAHLETTHLKIEVIKGHNYDLMQICDAIIVASGTATLEVTLSAKPMVIIYKLSTLNYLLSKLLVKIAYIGLCNIISGKAIIKEFIQRKAKPEAIFAEIDKILSDENYRDKLIADLSAVKQLLSVKADKDITELTIDMLS